MSNTRPPIVTILGHVDHGKTTLLDAIRKTNVATREVGGITQKIGAYTVQVQGTVDSGQKDSKSSDLEPETSKLITFIDTPGHEAFQAMRGRGAKVADIVILVVAANEGAKPQTRESLSIIQNAKIPFIVAITKIDLANANPDQVKNELSSLGVDFEGQGGNVPVVNVSAKTGEGIKDLLEMITLVTDVHGLQGEEEDPLRAFIIESKTDGRRGPVATVVVSAGKITVGEEISAENAEGRVRAIVNDKGENVREIKPGQAAEILGFDSVPPVGARVVMGKAGSDLQSSPDEPTIDESKRLNLIVKADTLGALEALVSSLPDDVGVLTKGVGDINQNDIMLASSFKLPILGFNVKVLPQVSDLVQKEGAVIMLFSLIHEAIAWINLPQKSEEKEEKILGKAEVRAQFPYGENEKIAGVIVTEGRISKGDNLRITRGSELVGQTFIRSLHQGQNSVGTVAKGGECGIIFRSKVDFKIGDVVESVKL